jgi:RNA-binding protein
LSQNRAIGDKIVLTLSIIERNYQKIMSNLSNTQIRYLKGLSHELNAVVMIGDKGLTTAVMDEIKIALEAHELIKINIRADDREQKNLIIEKIIQKTQSSKVQTIGGKLVIFKSSKECKIAIPK